jgi:hypothetical protein
MGWAPTLSTTRYVAVGARPTAEWYEEMDGCGAQGFGD